MTHEQIKKEAEEMYPTKKGFFEQNLQSQNNALRQDGYITALQRHPPGEWFEKKFWEWCKETKRSGGVLVGGSIKEFFQWLKSDKNNER